MDFNFNKDIGKIMKCAFIKYGKITMQENIGTIGFNNFCSGICSDKIKMMKT